MTVHPGLRVQALTPNRFEGTTGTDRLGPEGTPLEPINEPRWQRSSLVRDKSVILRIGVFEIRIGIKKRDKPYWWVWLCGSP